MSELLLSSIANVLSNWSALQFGLENKFGTDPRVCAGHIRSFSECIVSIVRDPSNQSLTEDDLAEYLVEQLSSELRTDVEDGSEMEVASSILSLYRQYVSGALVSEFHPTGFAGSKIGQKVPVAEEQASASDSSSAMSMSDDEDMDSHRDSESEGSGNWTVARRK